MREIILSNCERNFIHKAIAEGTRLDGRQLLESRPVKFYFGSNWGCCYVVLGHTKAVAQVSCDIQQPQASRPNEGMLDINVEINPMAAPHIEAGRRSEDAILINGILEKCLKNSKCIDLESLCIVADKKVWNLRVDIHIINHDGNLIDCACIAALAALSHFHRPDVTSTGDEVVIHSFTEKDPLPITLYHYPVCVSFIVFENGEIVMDPTYIEEKVGVAQLTMGINSHNELCKLHFDNLTKTSVAADVTPIVSNHAAKYAAELVQHIKETVHQDVQARYNKEERSKYRLQDCIATDKLTAIADKCFSINLSKWNMRIKDDDEVVNMEEDQDENYQILKVGEGSALLITDESKSIGVGGQNTWEASESSEDEVMNDVELLKEVKSVKTVIDDIELSGDSEEEATMTMTADDLMT